MTVGIVALVLAVLAVGLLLGGQQFSLVGEEAEEDGVTGACELDTSPQLTINSKDKRSAGSSLSGVGVYRKTGTTSWTDFTIGEAITGLEANQEYEFAIGLNTSSEKDNNHGDVFTKEIQCAPSETIEVEMSQYEDESGITGTFYNADNDASAETFSAGQTQDVEIKYQSGVDQFFGNNYLEGNSNVLCLDLNTSEWDEPESVRFNGETLSEVSEPKRFSGTATFDTYCYEAPIMDDSDNRITLKMNADDSNAPTVDGTAYLYAAGHTINSETGALESGVEDEEGNAVGTDAAISVTLDFTS